MNGNEKHHIDVNERQKHNTLLTRTRKARRCSAGASRRSLTATSMPRYRAANTTPTQHHQHNNRLILSLTFAALADLFASLQLARLNHAFAEVSSGSLSFKQFGTHVLVCFVRRPRRRRLQCFDRNTHFFQPVRSERNRRCHGNETHER